MELTARDQLNIPRRASESGALPTMKYAPITMVLLLALVGCSGDDANSADNEKLKASLSKGGDRNAMTPAQQNAMEEYMKKNGQGGAASSPKTPGGN